MLIFCEIQEAVAKGNHSPKDNATGEVVFVAIHCKKSNIMGKKCIKLARNSVLKLLAGNGRRCHRRSQCLGLGPDGYTEGAAVKRVRLNSPMIVRSPASSGSIAIGSNAGFTGRS